MGKGDKKTKKGKIWRGSFGNSRPKAKGPAFTPSTSEKVVSEAIEVKPKPRKKAAPKKKAADK